MIETLTCYIYKGLLLFIFGSDYPCFHLSSCQLCCPFPLTQNTDSFALSICTYYCAKIRSYHYQFSYEHFKASADDVIPSTKSVRILKSLVGVKMSRQQRLEAEADVSTSYGSLDLHRLFNNGSTREGSASTTSFGAEEEAVALAAFNGDLRSVVDAKMAKKSVNKMMRWKNVNSHPTPLIPCRFLHWWSSRMEVRGGSRSIGRRRTYPPLPRRRHHHRICPHRLASFVLISVAQRLVIKRLQLHVNAAGAKRERNWSMMEQEWRRRGWKQRRRCW